MREMGRMRRVAQRVEDQHVEPLEDAPRSPSGMRADVGARRRGRRSGSRGRRCRRGRRGTAAPSSAPPGPSTVDRRADRRSVRVEDRRIEAARRRLEAVAEARTGASPGRRVGVDRHAPAHVDRRAGRRSSMPWVWSACSWVKSTPSRRRHSASSSCSRRSGEVSTSTRGRAARSAARSTRIEQRRRRFLGSAGSQAPQPLPTRGTPPEEPQPRIVTVRSCRRAASPRPIGRAAFANRRSKFARRERARSRPGRRRRVSARTRAVWAT